MYFSAIDFASTVQLIIIMIYLIMFNDKEKFFIYLGFALIINYFANFFAEKFFPGCCELKQIEFWFAVRISVFPIFLATLLFYKKRKAEESKVEDDIEL